MTKHLGVQSTIKPDTVNIDEHKVYIASDVIELQHGDFKGYSYTLIEYDKDEYIKLMDEKNRQLESQQTDIQIALVELYEGVL